MQTTSSEHPTIDLTVSFDVYTPSKIIHYSEFDKALNMIKQQVQEAEKLFEHNDSKDSIRAFSINKTILVNGGRGTGKTTFLRALENRIQNSNEPLSNGQKLKDCVEVLSFLDPTIIEHKASIFLTIISLIQEKVDAFFNNQGNCEQFICKKRCWFECLSKLADGIPFANESPKTNPDFWADGNQVMNKGLRDTKAAFNLRNNFQTIITNSLKLLGKKSYILFIDDVDTDISKAYDLLEIFRKYLSIPGIITILTGDINLYTLVKKDFELSQFHSFLKNDNNQRVFEQINELSGQYISKILPVKYRINLPSIRTLNDLSISLKQKIAVKYGNGIDQETSVDEFLRIVFYKWGINNNWQRKAYTDYILNLPLRTNIEFMRQYKEILIDETFSVDINIESLINIFIDDLISKNVDTDILKERLEYITGLILRTLVENKCLSDFYQLEPVSDDQVLNGVLFTLNLTLEQYVKDYTDLIFDYLLKVGFTRNVAKLFDKNIDGQGLSFQGMLNYVSIFSGKDLRQMTCEMVAYIHSQTLNNKWSKTPCFLSILVNKDSETFSSALKMDSDNLEDCLVRIPLSRSVSNKGTFEEYSFFTYLAAVCDLIRECKSGNQIDKAIMRVATLRDYTMPENEDISDASKIESEKTTFEDKIPIRVMSGHYGNFAEDIGEWREYCKALIPFIPTHVLAKFSTRLYYAISRIEINKQTLLKQYMEFCVCNLFNAALIEEVNELSSGVNSSYNDIKIRNMNIRTNIDYIFGSNFSFAQSLFDKCQTPDSERKLPLTKILLTCPFFYPFIDFSTDYGKKIMKWYESISLSSNLNNNKKNIYRWHTSLDDLKKLVSCANSFGEAKCIPSEKNKTVKEKKVKEENKSEK